MHTRTHILQSIATVRVVITDVNDNVPQFGSTSYTASFPEDTPIGVEVLTVRIDIYSLHISIHSLVSIYNIKSRFKYKDEFCRVDLTTIK